MIDATIVEPLEDGVNGNSRLTAHNLASLPRFNGQLFEVECHAHLCTQRFRNRYTDTSKPEWLTRIHCTKVSVDTFVSLGKSMLSRALPGSVHPHSDKVKAN